MKTILTIRATTHAEKEELLALNKIIVKGNGYQLALDELINWLRTKSKYENVELITIDEVSKKLIELMQEHDCLDS
jgi:hypothetical protein